MMINNSSPDAKRPDTVAGGVVGPVGDARKKGTVQIVATSGASPLSAPPQTTAANGGGKYAGAKKPMFLPESACG